MNICGMSPMKNHFANGAISGKPGGGTSWRLTVVPAVGRLPTMARESRRGGRLSRVILGTAAILTLATGLFAQSLGEAARKEKERRQGQAAAPSCKKFTDEDLGTYSAGASEPASSPAPPGAGPTAAPSAPTPRSIERASAPNAEPSMSQQEAYWRARAKATRQAVALLEAEVAAPERKPG